MGTPYFIINADSIEDNLKILRKVADETGCKILLAQKCFSCYALYPLIAKYLNGATASGLYEARLCHEEMPNAENHIFSPAFKSCEIDDITKICDYIIFNSPQQLSLFGNYAKNAGLQIGLRINPECSTQQGHAIYDPCAPGSRLGTTISVLEKYLATEEGQNDFKLVDGLHFHTLCEQNADDLATTLNAVEEKFGHFLPQMKWLNFGGGHHITRADYDIDLLKQCINKTQDKYGLHVYLE
ncbi:MAG: carboxynorspermidine decarboxylase, partial [Prevotellaceae bacterium]|nr:carboxynorspermidine decarboxylase [Prevotellaceae bacterium]